MTHFLDTSEIQKTTDLLAHTLYWCKQGNHVQFLVDPGTGPAVVARMRVALSRSRARNVKNGRKVDEFSMRHNIYPYTSRDGKRHDAIVIWTEKNSYHERRELLDDLVER